MQIAVEEKNKCALAKCLHATTNYSQAVKPHAPWSHV